MTRETASANREQRREEDAENLGVRALTTKAAARAFSPLLVDAEPE